MQLLINERERIEALAWQLAEVKVQLNRKWQDAAATPTQVIGADLKEVCLGQMKLVQTRTCAGSSLDCLGAAKVRRRQDELSGLCAGECWWTSSVDALYFHI